MVQSSFLGYFHCYNPNQFDTWFGYCAFYFNQWIYNGMEIAIKLLSRQKYSSKCLFLCIPSQIPWVCQLWDSLFDIRPYSFTWYFISLYKYCCFWYLFCIFLRFFSNIFINFPTKKLYGLLILNDLECTITIMNQILWWMENFLCKYFLI